MPLKALGSQQYQTGHSLPFQPQGWPDWCFLGTTGTQLVFLMCYQNKSYPFLPEALHPLLKRWPSNGLKNQPKEAKMSELRVNVFGEPRDMSVSFYFLIPFQQWSKWLQMPPISPAILS